MLSHEQPALSCQQPQPQHAEHITLHARTRTGGPRSTTLSYFYPNDLATELNDIAFFFLIFFPSNCFCVHEKNYEVVETEGKKPPNLLGSCHVIVNLWETVQIQYFYFPNEHRTTFELKLYNTQIQEFSFLHFPWSDSAMQPSPKMRQKAILRQNAKSPSYSQIPRLIFQGESPAETLQNHFLPLSSLWNSTLFPCRELRCKGIKIQTESLWWLSNQESFLTKPSCKSLASDHDTLEAPRTEQRLKNCILYPKKVIEYIIPLQGKWGWNGRLWYRENRNAGSS